MVTPRSLRSRATLADSSWLASRRTASTASAGGAATRASAHSAESSRDGAITASSPRQLGRVSAITGSSPRQSGRVSAITGSSPRQSGRVSAVTGSSPRQSGRGGAIPVPPSPNAPRRRSRRGGVKLGCFFMMMLLGLGGWAGAYVGDAYWKYYQYADAFKQEAKFAGHYTDRQIKQHLRSMADSLVLPDDAYEIVVERGRHHIVIDNQYYAHVNMGVVTRDFFFNPHAEADF